MDKEYLKLRYNCKKVECASIYYYRSSALILKDEDAVRWLNAYEGVNRCIDLRTYYEKKYVSKQNEIKEYISMPIGYNGVYIDKIDNPDINDYIEYYLSIMEQCEYVADYIVNMSLQWYGTFLLFCSAGKDRTGLVTAIMQKKMNVKKQDVMAEILQCSNLSDSCLRQLKESLNPNISIHDYNERFIISGQALQIVMTNYFG